MSVWFEGDGQVDCGIERVKQALENPGEFLVGIVSVMPGMTAVELVEQKNDSVTIRTDEGLMTRPNISRDIEAERVVIEFDEK